MACQFVFWISLALLAYTFAGYHLLIAWLARRRPAHRDDTTAQPHPGGVAAVVVAYNEAARIRARVENLRSSAMPVEVIVCSDGSTDATAAEAAAAGARVIEFPDRRGKAACLSEVIPSLDADIVVLADARQEFDPGTIPQLAAHFADPHVGAVSGLLRVGDAHTATGAGVTLYWNMETAVRQAESDFDSCIGCTGAVYAIRRTLFQPIPPDTILDDVVIPMQAATAGYRVVYNAGAEAHDPQPLDPAAETRRKTRTMSGNFQMLLRHPMWLLPWKNRLAFQLISHKYLRLAGPALLAALFLSSLSLERFAVYRAAFLIQVFLYVLAFAGLANPSLPTRLFSIPAGFLFLNLMTLRGFFRYLFGPRGGAWESGAADG